MSEDTDPTPFFEDREAIEESITKTLESCILKDQNEKALEACRRNDSSRLSSIIDEYVLVQHCCGDGCHGLLTLAAARNSVSCMEVLISRGWRVDDDSVDVFEDIECFWDSEGSHCHLLLSRKCTCGGKDRRHFKRSPLREAIRQNCSEAIGLLLGQGTKACEDTFAELFSVVEERPEVVEDLIFDCFKALDNDDWCGFDLKTRVIDEAVRREMISLMKRLATQSSTKKPYIDPQRACELKCSDEIFEFFLQQDWRRIEISEFQDQEGDPLPHEDEPFFYQMAAIETCIRQHAHGRAVRFIRSTQSRLLENINDHGMIALVVAADRGCTLAVRELIDVGVKTNMLAWTLDTSPIHQACYSRNLTSGALQALIGGGADVNLALKLGWMFTVYTDDSMKITLSTDYGVHIWLKNGTTPLHAVAFANTPFEEAKERAHLLIAAGADVNARDSLGNTALHYDAARLKSRLAEPNRVSLKALLVQAGADVNIRNDREQTAQDILDGAASDLSVPGIASPLSECDERDLVWPRFA